MSKSFEPVYMPVGVLTAALAAAAPQRRASSGSLSMATPMVKAPTKLSPAPTMESGRMKPWKALIRSVP